MINTVTIHGRLTRDPELRRTQNNNAVVNFAIANDTGWGDNKQTNFIDCVAWTKTAEHISQYFTKGQEAIVEGQLQSRQWEDKQGNKRTTLEINVRNIDFCGSKAENQQARVASSNNGLSEIEDDEEVPF